MRGRAAARRRARAPTGTPTGAIWPPAAVPWRREVRARASTRPPRPGPTAPDGSPPLEPRAGPVRARERARGRARVLAHSFVALLPALARAQALARPRARSRVRVYLRVCQRGAGSKPRAPPSAPPCPGVRARVCSAQVGAPLETRADPWPGSTPARAGRDFHTCVRVVRARARMLLRCSLSRAPLLSPRARHFRKVLSN